MSGTVLNDIVYRLTKFLLTQLDSNITLCEVACDLTLSYSQDAGRHYLLTKFRRRDTTCFLQIILRRTA